MQNIFGRFNATQLFNGLEQQERLPKQRKIKFKKIKVGKVFVARNVISDGAEFFFVCIICNVEQTKINVKTTSAKMNVTHAQWCESLKVLIS